MTMTAVVPFLVGFALADAPEQAFPEPPRLALGLGFGVGGGTTAPNVGLQLRVRPLLRVPVELEASLNPRWSSVSGGAFGAGLGVVGRPLLIHNRTMWFGVEVAGGAGYATWDERGVTPYARVGAAIGFAADWAPVVGVGVTLTPDAPPLPTVSVSWELGGRKRR